MNDEKKLCAACEREVTAKTGLTMAFEGKVKRICFKCYEKLGSMYATSKNVVPCGFSYSNESNSAVVGSWADGKPIAESEGQSLVGKQVLRPIQIKKKLDEYVVGQEDAKRTISVAMYNHYKRTYFGDEEVKKSNIVMIGPTGSGKTYLVETLAKIMNMPVALCTATTLTEAGYIGADVESVVQRLYDVCERDIEKTQKGIIFIDEVDKLCASSNATEKKVGGVGVQQALLRLLEGTVVDLKVGRSAFGGEEQVVHIDTSNILFICGGAFPDAEQIIAKRLNKKTSKTIGFSADVIDEGQEVTENLLRHITTDDLREFGLIPEFIGRLPVIATLEELSVDTLVKILSEPKGCLLSQYQKLFSYDGIRLTMEDAAIRKVAELAVKKGTGARSLRAIMEEVLTDLMFTLPGTDAAEVCLTAGFIDKLEGPYIQEKASNVASGAW